MSYISQKFSEKTLKNLLETVFTQGVNASEQEKQQFNTSIKIISNIRRDYIDKRIYSEEEIDNLIVDFLVDVGAVEKNTPETKKNILSILDYNELISLNNIEAPLQDFLKDKNLDIFYCKIRDNISNALLSKKRLQTENESELYKSYAKSMGHEASGIIYGCLKAFSSIDTSNTKNLINDINKMCINESNFEISKGELKISTRKANEPDAFMYSAKDDQFLVMDVTSLDTLNMGIESIVIHEIGSLFLTKEIREKIPDLAKQNKESNIDLYKRIIKDQNNQISHLTKVLDHTENELYKHLNENTKYFSDILGVDSINKTAWIYQRFNSDNEIGEQNRKNKDTLIISSKYLKYFKSIVKKEYNITFLSEKFSNKKTLIKINTKNIKKDDLIKALKKTAQKEIKEREEFIYYCYERIKTEKNSHHLDRNLIKQYFSNITGQNTIRDFYREVNKRPLEYAKEMGLVDENNNIDMTKLLEEKKKYKLYSFKLFNIKRNRNNPEIYRDYQENYTNEEFRRAATSGAAASLLSIQGIKGIQFKEKDINYFLQQKSNLLTNKFFVEQGRPNETTGKKFVQKIRDGFDDKKARDDIFYNMITQREGLKHLEEKMLKPTENETYGATETPQHFQHISYIIKDFLRSIHNVFDETERKCLESNPDSSEEEAYKSMINYYNEKTIEHTGKPPEIPYEELYDTLQRLSREFSTLLSPVQDETPQIRGNIIQKAMIKTKKINQNSRSSKMRV